MPGQFINQVTSTKHKTTSLINNLIRPLQSIGAEVFVRKTELKSPARRAQNDNRKFSL